MDYLYPPRCGGCGVNGTRWCPDCQSKVRLLTGSVCSRCGRQVDGWETQSILLCGSCQNYKPKYESLRSWAYYDDPIRLGIHRIKYQSDFGLGEFFSRFLIDMFSCLRWDVDMIVPVPSGIDRKAERGYNQVTLMAYPLALATGVKFCSKALKKIKNTPSQVGLSIPERIQNVNGAFSANRAVVDGKSILLMDDICTSGATISACTQALLDAAAENVYALTLARASINIA